MMIALIVLKKPDGSFDHVTHGRDAEDTAKLFELLKETRSAEKIPVMELHIIQLGEPSQTHTKTT